MDNKEFQRKPSPEYRFWLYDPEGDGMIYFNTAGSRDKAGAIAIRRYLDDSWSEEVEYVSAGELTSFAQVLKKEMRPTELDDDGCDEDGYYWGDAEWRGNYDLAPLTGVENDDVGVEIERLNGIIAIRADALAKIRSMPAPCEPRGIDKPIFDQWAETTMLAKNALTASSETVSSYLNEVRAKALEDFGEPYKFSQPNIYDACKAAASELRTNKES